MAIDFMAASNAAASDLKAARKQRAKLQAKAQARVDAAKQRYRAELAEAEVVEADAWARMMDVPGMTVGTAASIGGVSQPTASKLIKLGRDRQSTSCS